MFTHNFSYQPFSLSIPIDIDYSPRTWVELDCYKPIWNKEGECY